MARAEAARDNRLEVAMSSLKLRALLAATVLALTIGGAIPPNAWFTIAIGVVDLCLFRSRGLL